MTDDKGKDKEKDSRRTFSLTEPQIREISFALEKVVTDLADELNDKEQAQKDYGKSTVKSMSESYDILAPLNEYFQQLRMLVEGMPETEPVLKCEFLKSKAMKENYEEQNRRYKKRLELLRKYKQYP